MQLHACEVVINFTKHQNIEMIDWYRISLVVKHSSKH